MWWALLLLPLANLPAGRASEEDGTLRGAFELSAVGRATNWSTAAGIAEERALEASLFPSFALAPTPEVQLELGARLRIVNGTRGVSLRTQDWDETSDFGQVIQALQLGSDATVVSLSAGPAFLRTLGHGHLVKRYWNRAHADYHPASAEVAFASGPVRVDAFASDVLAARLFAAEVAVDLGRLLVESPALDDRFHAAVSVAHDEGRAGGSSLPLTSGYVDVDAAVVRNRSGAMTLLAGLGGRPGSNAGFGASLGVGLEGRFRGARLAATGELRRRTGGFVHGVFGPGYELARFSAVGFSGVPVAEELRAPTTSGTLELSVEVEGTVAPVMSASVVIDGVWTNRLDIDGVLTIAPAGLMSFLLRTVVSGVGDAPRLLLLGEGRIRVMPSVYALLNAGTQFTRNAAGGLERAWLAGLGVGVDFNGTP